MKTKTLILFGILLLALVLRIYKLNANTMYGDELTMVYDTYSISRTAKDQMGNFLPVTFEMGAGRPGGYIYFSVPFVATLGVNEYGIRALSLLSGMGIVLLVYLIGERWFSKRTALIASFLAAISMWGVGLSRGAYESNFALFLSLLGIYSFLKAKTNVKYLLLSTLSFGLAIHTYPTYKFSLFLFIPLLIWHENWFRKKYVKAKKTIVLLSVLIIAVFGLVSIHQTFFGISEARFSEINIFSSKDLKESVLQKVNYERTISNSNPLLSKVLLNRPISYATYYLNNYLKNLSVEYLLISGDGNPRHNMFQMGLLFWFEIITVILGMVFGWIKYKRTTILLLLWVFIVPLATAMVGPPHTLRNSFMFPAFCFLSALGVTYLFAKPKSVIKKLLIIFLALLLSIQLIFAYSKMYYIFPIANSRFWAYPAKEAVNIGLLEKDNYDYIIISTRINDVEYAYYVYAAEDPEKVMIGGEEIALEQLSDFKRFGNVYLGTEDNEKWLSLADSLEGSVLMVLDSDKDISALKDYETITMPDGTTSFALYSSK